MTSTIAQRTSAGAMRWLLMAVPTALWIVHLAFSAAFVELSCAHPGWRWTLYAVTPITVLPILGAAWIAVTMHKGASTVERLSEAEQEDLRFFAWLAFVVCVVNITLIVAEGALVPFISSCA
jgi:hypothetical protein